MKLLSYRYPIAIGVLLVFGVIYKLNRIIDGNIRLRDKVEIALIITLIVVIIVIGVISKIRSAWSNSPSNKNA